MPDSTPTRKSVFIEKIMPVTLLNEQVYYEHGGNPFKGLHRWYSWKPLSFSRASVLGSLLSADVLMEEFEYLLGLNRRGKDGLQDKTTKLSKTPPSQERIQRVQELCEQMWGTKTPTVLDAFAGGGSIPFEAARYGLNVLASDLNPVAVVTMKAAIEYPLKFGADLQVEIDKWVKWVGDEAEKRLAPFFPSLPGEKVQNYLWAHTVKCPNCESIVPLSPNWWLSKTSNYGGKGLARKVTSDWYAVRPIPNLAEKRVDFELVQGKKGKGTTIIARRGGRVDRQDACPTGLDQDAVAQASSLQITKNPQLKTTKRRLPHWELDGSVYFVTFNTWEKLELSEAAQQVVLDTCRFFDGQRYKIFAIVIMPDHVHWLIQPLQKSEDESWSLSSIMHSIKSYSANQISKVMKHLGMVWQIEWHDRIIRDEQEFENTWEYIRQNPVKANLCEQPEDYAFLWQLNNPVGQASSLPIIEEEYDPDTATTISRAVGKCPNCGNVIADDVIKTQFQIGQAGHQLYAVAGKYGKGGLEFRIPEAIDLEGIYGAEKYLRQTSLHTNTLLPLEEITHGQETERLFSIGINSWDEFFNPRQLLTLVTYVEILNEVKEKLRLEYEPEKAEAIATYLALVFDRCADMNCKLSGWDSTRAGSKRASAQHSLNLMWNYPEICGAGDLWHWCADALASDYQTLCNLINATSDTTIPEINSVGQASSLQINQDDFMDGGRQDACPTGFKFNRVGQASSLQPSSSTHATEAVKMPALRDIGITLASADSLFHIADQSVDTIVTDPPYYGTIQYAELSDFFYVWQKRTLGDIFPDLFASELTDKDREPVANLSRFRNMCISPEILANQDYEAKMAMAFAEYYRVLRDDGVMTVQFNHKDSGAWDVLAKSLIDAGFEITASWAVSIENPQNLHQAQKNSVSSTVLLVCRKRDLNAGQAWWDDLRPDVANRVEQRAPEFEANDITDIDLYLSAFDPALNVFSRHYPILDSSGNKVRPKEAFAEARRAIANYRFYKLAQTDTQGFDPLTTWYMLAWDAFGAIEFPFDEARQLALAVGGFDISALKGSLKLLEVKGGTCKFLMPQQRFKKRAFSLTDTEFSARYLIDALHAIITLYLEEGTIEPVRRFLKATGLLSNDLFMRSWEVALKVIPRIGDERKRLPEEKALADLWLAMDEIKAKVVYVQPELELGYGQQSLNFNAEVSDE